MIPLACVLYFFFVQLKPTSIGFWGTFVASEKLNHILLFVPYLLCRQIKSPKYLSNLGYLASNVSSLFPTN